MADFRRWFIALSVLALMAGLASAQIGPATGGTAGPLACTANAAGTPQLRPEGYTELLGDILITCTGGPLSATGSLIPTTNITVYVTQQVAITSRLFSSSTNASEALLLIDDPGSTLATGVVGPFGPKAPQIRCTALQGGCPAYVGTDNGYVVSVNAAGGTTSAANVYQGVLGSVSTNSQNQVTFYGVPVLPPVSNGVQRTFRITNIRIPTTSLGTQTGISVFLSTNPSTVLPITLASLPVGIVGLPLQTSVQRPDSSGATLTGGAATSNPVVLQQCAAQTATPVLNLLFKEGFATAFKTRVVPTVDALWNAQQSTVTGTFGGTTATSTQSIPGGLYGGLAQNSESGFIFPQIGGGSYVAGLADFGTRLKAVFTNIPTGVTLYVSGTNREYSGQTYLLGGLTTKSAAVLVYNGSSSFNEAIIDGSTGGSGTSNFGTAGSSGGGINEPISSTYTPVQIVPNSSGVATAVWEVVNSDPASVETFTFTVYIGYKVQSGSTSATAPYGLPNITGIPGQPVTNVTMSFAPEPGGGTFTTTNGPLPGAPNFSGVAIPIPRFANLANFSAPFATINLCQTTLLYPYVISSGTPTTGGFAGFDTGIAIANTSKDPFTNLGISTTPSGGTVAQTGSCTLYPYGITVTSTGSTSGPPAQMSGCDQVTNPVPGQNCFPIVAPGTVQSILASGWFSGFQGYIIAVCNFQYAHGYAAVTDIGLRGLFSSYLAIELNTSSTPGQPRGTSVEFNAH